MGKKQQDSYTGTIASWGTKILNPYYGKQAFTVLKEIAVGGYLVYTE